jgi:hypothetical protein
VIAQLKQMAKIEGLKYQPYIRKCLIQLATANSQEKPLTESRVLEIIDRKFEQWKEKQSDKNKAAS